MKNNYITVIFVLIFTISTAITGCGSQSNDFGGQTNSVAQQQASGNDYQNINSETLKQMMNTEKDLLIVDVREQAELYDGHITGAKLIPLSEFQTRVNELPKDKKIVLVCLSGSRTPYAATYMLELGYSQIYNLIGGMSAWPYEVSN